jgi:hypothetical protein
MNNLREYGKHFSRTVLGQYRYEIFRFFIAHKRKLNLTNPLFFNDKLVWRKMYDYNPAFSSLSDKALVRKFVDDKCGKELLTKVYFGSEDVKLIDLDDLPQQFVIKATHGSGKEFLKFVYDKRKLNRNEFLNYINKLINKEYGYITNEWWYTKIKPSILIEELLVDNENGIPLDYKFYVFHGRVKYIEVDYARYRNISRTYYDTNWQPQEFIRKYKRGPVTPPPSHLGQMTEIAEQLGKDLVFVRVDLYCVNDDRIVFGEMTLAPGAGWSQFTPTYWDEVWGGLW